MRDQGTRSSRAADLCLGVGGVLLLAYALPLFAPPAALPVALPPPDATVMARMFPHVPAWWMTARLVALLIGAVLVAAVTKRSVLPRYWHRSRLAQHGATAAVRHGRPGGGRPACWLSALDRAASAGRSAALRRLAGGARGPARLGARRRAAGWPGRWQPLGGRGSAACSSSFGRSLRLWIAWHSPRVANVVDMWRTFAALVRMTTAHENLLSNSIDPEIPGRQFHAPVLSRAPDPANAVTRARPDLGASREYALDRGGRRRGGRTGRDAGRSDRRP